MEKKFIWKITAYTENFMDIQLVFDEPQNVSTSNRLDRIKITFNDTRYFFDSFG